MAFFAFPRLSVLRCLALAGLVATVAGVAATTAARSEALLLVEADTGKVLQADNATYPWYPASLTKLMTAYVTLYGVKQGSVSLDKLLTVSPNAAAQPPAKMGLKPGTQLTVDNALKMMLVKSANDMAVVIAEGLGGSVDGFAEQMNANAQRLGMTQTNYVNPNGLPADGHVSSARDLAILTRAIIRDLPEYESYFHIPAIKYGRRVTANYNKLIGRYPGADGMKTGFICASGFNLVATATRNGKRLIAVVLGASSSAQRSVKAAQLLERGFHGNKLAWLKPSLGLVNMLQPIDAAPPNLRDDVCGPKRKRPAAEDEDDEDVEVNADTGEGGVAAYAAGLQAPTMKASELMATAAAPTTPIIVYTGPARTGADVLAADAAESARQDAARPVGKKKKGAGRSKLAAAKPDADKPDAKGDAKADAKPAAGAAKPVAAKPVAAKPVAAKPVAAAAKPASAAKPAVTAKPAAAKPAATPASAPAKPKPAAKDTKNTAKPASDQKS